MAAFCAGAVATFASRTVARRLGIVNHPNPIVAQHVKATPYLGGFGVVIGAVLVWIFGEGLPPHLARMLLPTVAFLALGLADDLKAFSPRPKMMLQIAASLLAVGCGASMSISEHAAVNVAASVFCIVFFVNAFNFTDVADGLVGGLSVLFFATAALLLPSCAWLAWPVAGASAGFLVFNRPRASIFLGDAGSHVLGFWAAALTMQAMRSGGWANGAAMMVAAGVFVFETFFITIVRIRKGLPWWRGSPDHVALRLQAAGLSTLNTDVLLWMAGSLFSACAWSFLHVFTMGRLLLAGLLLTGSFATGTLLVWLESTGAGRFAPGRRARSE